MPSKPIAQGTTPAPPSTSDPTHTLISEIPLDPAQSHASTSAVTSAVPPPAVSTFPPQLPDTRSCAASVCPTGIAGAPSSLPQPYGGTLIFTEQRQDALAYLPTSATAASPQVTTIDSGQNSDGLSPSAQPTGIAVGADGNVWFAELGNSDKHQNGIGELKLVAPRVTINPVGSGDPGTTTDPAPALSGTFSTAPGDLWQVAVSIAPSDPGCTPTQSLQATASTNPSAPTWQVPDGSYGPLVPCAYTVNARQTDAAGNSTTSSLPLVVQDNTEHDRGADQGSVQPSDTGQREPASVAVGPRVARLKPGDVIALRLTCLSAGGCAGTVALTTSVGAKLARVALGHRGNATAARLRHVLVRLGSARFNIPGSQTITVKIRLSGPGRRLVSVAHRLGVLASVLARNAAGAETRSTGQFTLVIPRRARAGARRPRR